MHPQTIEVPPLDLRAALADINEDKRTVSLTWSTGADVIRYDWMTGKRYIERLSLDPKHVRLERLNNGAPLLDSHSAYTLAHQIGVVEDGTASVDGKRGRASVRFPKADDDPDVDRIFRKVKDKILRNVSVGYRVHRFEETQGKNELPIRLATDWEPYEVSLVPMGADSKAQVRSSKDVPTNPCVIVLARGEDSVGALSTADADRLRRLRLARVRATA